MEIPNLATWKCFPLLEIMRLWKFNDCICFKSFDIFLTSYDIFFQFSLEQFCDFSFIAGIFWKPNQRLCLPNLQNFRYQTTNKLPKLFSFLCQCQFANTLIWPHQLYKKFVKETIFNIWRNDKYFSVLLIYQLFGYSLGKIQLKNIVYSDFNWVLPK